MKTNHSVLWDEKISVIRFSGEGNKVFLNGQITIDVINAETGIFHHACWLDSFGRLRAILEIKLEDTFADVYVLSGKSEEFKYELEKIIFPADKVTIESCFQARRIQLIDNKSPRFSDIEWVAYDDLLPNQFQQFPIASENQISRWRMIKGIPKILDAFTASLNPFEMGLAELINRDKGCYLGQEVIARIIRKFIMKKQLTFWESDKNLSSGSMLFVNNSYSEKKKCAVILFSLCNHDTGFGFGLASMNSDYLLEDKYYYENNLIKVKFQIVDGCFEPN